MPSIAIDGPSGAGKSTVSIGVAQALGLIHLDSGAMYRAVGMDMSRRGVDLQDAAAVAAAVPEVNLTVTFENGQRARLDGIDVTEELPKYSYTASQVSKVPQVREKVNQIVRGIANERGVVVDGRDIGTTVLPKADLKIYLTADPRERARRRYLELVSRGMDAQEEQVYRDILQRDYEDTHRAVSPWPRRWTPWRWTAPTSTGTGSLRRSSAWPGGLDYEFWFLQIRHRPGAVLARRMPSPGPAGQGTPERVGRRAAGVQPHQHAGPGDPGLPVPAAPALHGQKGAVRQ